MGSSSLRFQDKEARLENSVFFCSRPLHTVPVHRKRLEKAFPSQLGEKGANPDLCFLLRDLFSRRTREINAKIFFLRKMWKQANHVLTFKDGFYARRMNRMKKNLRARFASGVAQLALKTRVSPMRTFAA